ncbi:MAG: T9SS type A sorting domain-containing protein, partial [bacterium]
SNIGGDTLFISQEVYDFEWDGDLGNFDYLITGIDCNEDYGFVFGGACEWCDVSDKTEPVRFIYFWNGGIDIACADSIDRRGDLNLNGIDNEIADAVLYTNYFLYGIVVFDIAVDGQIAASDVNNDGLSLSLGDLVYLIRIITGDALPFPKLAPFAHTAEVNVVNGVVTTDAASELGGVFAVYNVSGAVEVISNTDMEVVSHEANGELRVLVYSGLNNTTNRIPAGTNELFTVVGEAELVKVEVADYSGNVMNTRVAKTVLPTDYALLQNTPNPFNPTTKITLELPTVTDWNVDIYNVAGQLVTRFNGTDVGVKTIEWNADGVASGIYFYKATAGNFTDTKKMVLMK